ncbi:MAG: hypothetical protein JW731_03555, partial [Bacteroidales bacterium]|nr:hypothetical protein [Bacteroidales bacterium]
YDIVSSETNPDSSVKFYCVADKKEKELQAHLKAHVSNNTDNPSDHQKDSKSFQKIPVKDYFLQDHINQPFGCFSIISYPRIKIQVLSDFVEEYGPPPKYIS